MMGRVELDLSLYPNITELCWAGSGYVEAYLGRRCFRVCVCETHSAGAQPLFCARYEEKTQIEIDHEWRWLWVEADLPWQSGDTAEECMRAALAQVNNA